MMKKSTSRRAFLKDIGMGAAAAGVAACAPDPSGPEKAGEGSPIVHRSAVRQSWETDVLVVGGGPAGIGAAIGAARQGVKVLLIENHAFFGGVGAWALGMPINQVRPKGKPRSNVHELLISKLTAYGPQAVHVGEHQLWTNVDYLKAAIADAMDAAGVKYFLHTRAADAVVEGNRVTGVIAATKSGLVRIQAGTVIDCTGDADVAQYAGAETMKETGKLSPMTLLLKVTNVDLARAKKVKMVPVADAARAKYPLIPKTWAFEDSDPSSNSFYINHSCTRDFANYDGSDPESFSQAEVFARRQALQMTEAMREFGGPDLASIELIGTSPQICVRETRRVKGVYVLTEEDALQGRTFEDAVAWRSGFLDIGYTRLEDMKIHDVPYRSILPEKTDGLLTAGRCISASHVAASAGKSMGNCMATGHAAGVAAAMCAKEKILPREVSVPKLREALRAEGVDFSMGGQDQKGLVLIG
jgi:ribulose 1,5-bisphosphate synthetase/thiazole synthase